MSRVGIVIFGATGFTGKRAVLEMVRLSKKHPAVTWAVAGRSQSKLETLMQDVAAKTGEDQSHIKIIIADVSDEESLRGMCLQAKVIANCCGPYRLYGEPVVRAAIEAGAHHVDVTGEPQFIETMQLKYSQRAAEGGVYVISACGYDSIPNDLGTVFLQQHFGGTLNSVESYMSSLLPPELQKEAVKQGFIHYATWESLVYGLAYYNELKPLRMQLYPERLPSFEPKLEKRAVLHYREEGWCVPFPGADHSVVYRTQRALYEAAGQRPAHFRVYVTLGAWLYAAAALIGATFVYLLTRFSFTRNLLLEYPRLFTLGIVTHQGPSTAVMENTSYTVKLYGEGWAEGTDVKQRPNKRVIAQVSGMNPGYGATVSALLYSAITIIEERDKMPGKKLIDAYVIDVVFKNNYNYFVSKKNSMESKDSSSESSPDDTYNPHEVISLDYYVISTHKSQNRTTYYFEPVEKNGGVLTTGYAFRNTSIIKHLSENNMKFEIVETSDI